MIQSRVVTILEFIGVLLGLGLLGVVGTTVTPHTPERASEVAQGMVPGSSEHLAETFRMDECVRTIAPRSILSEQASGAPEVIVLEGAPVTECFPGLKNFHATRTAGTSQTSVGSSPEEYFGGTPVSTSVVVLPRTPAQASSSTATLQEVVVLQRHDSLVRSTSTPTVATPTPSPFSGGGSTQPQERVPSVDRFDECRIKLFGGAIPETLTLEESSAFEACVLE